MRSQPRIAVLVDADNVSGDQIRFAVDEAAKCGQVVLKRAFGRLNAIRAHEEVLTELGFSAEVALPQVGNGKNAADLLLAQYAQRLGERRAVKAVAIVSSDSDFAVVASALAEYGIAPMGFGRADAPLMLREACAIFTDFPEPAPQAIVAPATTAVGRDLAKLKRVVDATMNKNGRALAQVVGGQISRAFDAPYRDRFGVEDLEELLSLIGGYRVRKRGAATEVIRADAA